MRITSPEEAVGVGHTPSMAWAWPGPHWRFARPRNSSLFLVLPLGACEGMQNVLAPGSPDAAQIATLSWWFFSAAVFILTVTLGLLAVALTLRKPDRPVSSRFRTGLVVSGGVIAPVIAIVLVAISGVAISDQTEGRAAESGPVIEVVGHRWWWELRYLDERGDTVAVTANEMHLPAGERATLRLTSADVIHSFWAPNIQGKTDLIPGATNVLYAEPLEPGRWRGQCAEFCGAQHALMGFVVVAEPPGDFAAWLAQEAAPAAVTDHPGLDVFLSLGCGECHAIRGTAADGRRGPDLTHVASRETLAAATLPNSRGNMGGWITSTHAIKDGVLMPAYAPEPEDLFALLDFLEALE